MRRLVESAKTFDAAGDAMWRVVRSELAQAGGNRLLTLAGHSSEVVTAAFSSNGNSVVTGSWDNTAIVWDARTGARVATLKGHSGWAITAEFSSDGNSVVTASDDNTAIVWDA